MEDARELLRQYAAHRSEDAFAELVRRHVNLVYSAALRQVGGDAHLAKDVSQAVFLALAHNARALAGRDSILGWLYTTTRFIAAKTVRAHQRWQVREHQAQHMRMLPDDSPTDADWQRLRPILDETMCDLSERDRDAILLRYFEGLPYAEIGRRCHVAENAARMRVDRSLEKLREGLARRGVTSTAVALGTVLSAHAVTAAPAGAAIAITSVALAGAAASGTSISAAALAAGVFEVMSMKLKLGIAGAVIASAAITYVALREPASEEEIVAKPKPVAVADDDALQRELDRLRAENQRLRDEVAGVVATPARSDPARDARERAMQRLDILRDAKQRGLVDFLMVRTLTNDRHLNDEFARLFHLTFDERQELTAALERAKQQLAVHEVANARVRQEADGGNVIEVQPFAEAGGAIYDEFLKSFASTLGEERNAAFLELAVSQLEETLGRFGAAQRTVTVTETERSNDQADQFHLQLESKFPNGHATQTRFVGDRRALAAELGALARLLPARVADAAAVKRAGSLAGCRNGV